MHVLLMFLSRERNRRSFNLALHHSPTFQLVSATTVHHWISIYTDVSVAVYVYRQVWRSTSLQNFTQHKHTSGLCPTNRVPEQGSTSTRRRRDRNLQAIVSHIEHLKMQDQDSRCKINASITTFCSKYRNKEQNKTLSKEQFFLQLMCNMIVGFQWKLQWWYYLQEDRFIQKSLTNAWI